MDADERIAAALEKQVEMMHDVGTIIKWVIYVFGILAVMAVLFLFLATPVYNYVNHDLLGNDYPTTVAIKLPPIDDCYSSNDRQLCFQMQRIADAIVGKAEPKLFHPHLSNAGNIWTPVTTVFDDYKYWDTHNGTRTFTMSEWNCDDGLYVVFNNDRTKYACDEEFSIDSPYFDSNPEIKSEMNFDKVESYSDHIPIPYEGPLYEKVDIPKIDIPLKLTTEGMPRSHESIIEKKLDEIILNQKDLIALLKPKKSTNLGSENYCITDDIVLNGVYYKFLEKTTGIGFDTCTYQKLKPEEMLENKK